jgi:hypothetical protein
VNNPVIKLLITALLMIPAAVALAQEQYFVELGNETSEEEILSEWQGLSTKYKDILGNLKFYPKIILRSDNRTVARMQAGPLESKKAAEKLCGRLFKDNTPCFIMEGVQPPPVQIVAQVASEPKPLPWLIKAAPPVQSSERRDSGMFSWILGKKERARQSAPAVVDPSQAEVEVAEAIRVPLTNAAKKPDDVQVNPVFPSAQLPTEKSVVGAAPTGQESGWLNVHAFANDESAYSFWEQVRGAIPAQAAGLRVRIIRPLMKNDRPTVLLNVGPFASQSDAAHFCRDGIEPLNRSLMCRFDRNEARGSYRLVSPSPYQRSDRYAARREQALPKSTPATADTAVMTTRIVPARLYWVQVATAADQIQAMNDWRTIRANNADLLDGLRTRISTSLMGQSGYVVRVGPINSNAEAMSLCNSLQSRGINCRIYSNM